MPECLTSGIYIGSSGWPSAGTWTIEYEAPTILYVWAQEGTYNAGVDEALSADGWVKEEADGFMELHSLQSICYFFFAFSATSYFFLFGSF